MAILLSAILALLPLTLAPGLLFYYDITPKIVVLLTGTAIGLMLARREGQARSPELRLFPRPGEPAALPGREVAVLYRQRRQGRGMPLSRRRIEGGELADQDGDRPVVGDDVVHQRQQPMLLRSRLSARATMPLPC